MFLRRRLALSWSEGEERGSVIYTLICSSINVCLAQNIFYLKINYNNFIYIFKIYLKTATVLPRTHLLITNLSRKRMETMWFCWWAGIQCQVAAGIRGSTSGSRAFWPSSVLHPTTRRWHKEPWKAKTLPDSAAN